MNKLQPVRSLLRALRLLAASQPRTFFLLACSHVITGLLPAGMVLVTQQVMDSLLMITEGQVNRSVLLSWFLAWGAATVVGPLLYLHSTYVVHYVQDRFKGTLQERLLNKVSLLSLADVESAATQNLIGRSRDVLLQETVLDVLMRTSLLTTALISVAAIIGAVWGYSPWLSLALLIAALPAGLFYLTRSHLSHRLMQAQTPIERRKSYSELLLSQREPAAELRLLGASSYLIDKYLAAGLQVAKLRLRFWRHQQVLSGVSDTFNTLGLTLITVVVAYLIAFGQLSVGKYIAVAVALQALATYTGVLFAEAGRLYQGGLLLGDLFALLDLPASPMTPGQESYAAHGDPLVEFQAVGFQYPNMTTPILTDLSFAIYPGQTVALVGENGAGKSTLAKLMLGLYVPTTGQIVRTQPRGESGSATMDAAASAVFQDYVSYQTTAAENIGFGDTTTLGDRERLERAAARAGADSVIHALPRGLETPLGRLVEGAVDLSGGQWQKLALARGAVRTARLLVLDEPTSASDPLSELEILTTFQKLADGQATLLVSHRLGAARMASHILVLEQGRLVEQGTHAQLVAKGGTYARLWETQARWYQEQSFDVLAGD